MNSFDFTLPWKDTLSKRRNSSKPLKSDNVTHRKVWRTKSRENLAPMEEGSSTPWGLVYPPNEAPLTSSLPSNTRAVKATWAKRNLRIFSLKESENLLAPASTRDATELFTLESVTTRLVSVSVSVSVYLSVSLYVSYYLSVILSLFSLFLSSLSVLSLPLTLCLFFLSA